MGAPDSDPDPFLISGLIGVYNAQGSFRGELGYVLAKLRGHDSCALCDITHQGLRGRRDFDEAVRRLPVRIDLIHLESRSADIGAASGWLAPCVLARTDVGLHLLLGPDALEACKGSPTALLEAVREAANQHALRWPVST